MPSNVIRRIDRTSLSCLVLIVLLAGALRIATLGESLWIDELHTSWSVIGDLSEVGPRARMGNNSPTYFYAIWLLAQVFGHSEIVYRSLACLAGLGLIIAVFCYTMVWTKSNVVALVVSMLMAIDPNLIFYSAEARPYACLQLCMLMSAAQFFQYVREGSTRSRLIWIVTTWIGFHLHYTSALLLVGELTYAGVTLAHRHRKKIGVSGVSWATLLVDLIWIAAIIALSSQHLLMIAGRRDNWAHFVHKSDWTALFDLFKTLRLVGIAILVFWLGKAYDFAKLRTSPSCSFMSLDHKFTRTLILYWGCCFLVPALTALMVNNLDIARLFFRRYLVSLIAPLYLLLASIMSLTKRKGFAVASAITLGLAASWSAPFQSLVGLNHHKHSRENWRAAIAKINATDQNSIVLLRTGLIEESEDSHLYDAYSQFPVRAIYPLGARRRCVPLPLQTERGEAFDINSFSVPKGNVAWLLIRGRQSTSDSVIQAVIESTANSKIGTARVQASEEYRFGQNIHLIRLKIE